MCVLRMNRAKGYAIYKIGIVEVWGYYANN